LPPRSKTVEQALYSVKAKVMARRAKEEGSEVMAGEASIYRASAGETQTGTA
jgi:hypothetical protein